MSARLAPSILSCDFTRLGEELATLARLGPHNEVHVDVMDGCFVSNISFGLPILAAARRATAQFLDVHLMIERPERFLSDFAAAGADGLSIHAEATAHPYRALQQIRELGKRAGVVLNPGMPLEALRPLLNVADLVLIMSVNPGFGGQAFLPESLERVRTVRRWLDEAGSRAELQVDGGIAPDNARALVEAGATLLVAGSSVFAPDGAEAGLLRLQKAIG